MNITGNVIKEIKKLDEFSQNIIFSDPPYALGNITYIDENNKPQYKGQAVDFMGKWNGISGSDLESMFIDFFRVLKHGGYCVFAGQMRQAMAFQYYAIASGFDMIEPIYSFSISNFPKALDVSKSLDKYFGEEREVVGETKFGTNFKHDGHTGAEQFQYSEGNIDITSPSSSLAKKYNGIKSSICPLKQTTEVWFIFRKPFKHGTITKDIIAYEEGDQTVAVSGLNIDGGRVGTKESLKRNCLGLASAVHEGYKRPYHETAEKTNYGSDSGRYPAQLFLDGSISYKREDIDLENLDFLEFVGIDSDVISFMETEKAIDYVCAHLDKFNVAELLDEQSGITKSWSGQNHNNFNPYGGNSFNDSETKREGKFQGYGDDAGCSRILHSASFTLTELYQHIYYSKPSRYERNALISKEVIEPKKYFHDGRTSPKEYPSMRDSLVSVNNHPTLKSLKLLYNIIQLFKTVDIEKMKILIPFSGVRSEKIAWLSHGAIEENITAIEISEEYDIIGEAREKFWIENDFFFKEDKEVQNKIKLQIEKDKEQVEINKKHFFSKKK